MTTLKPGDLPSFWRQRAESLKRFAPAAAEAFQDAAAELEVAFREEQGSTLNLRDAAKACGYSEDYLGRLVTKGVIPNLGRPRAPRVRVSDLPKKIVGHHPKPHLRAS